MAAVQAAICITGRVQGVWFRQSTKDMADKIGVTGWCRNNPDGSVEAVFEGEETKVKIAVSWCESGPKLAQVDKLEVKWQEATGEFPQFEIL